MRAAFGTPLSLISRLMGSLAGTSSGRVLYGPNARSSSPEWHFLTFVDRVGPMG